MVTIPYYPIPFHSNAYHCNGMGTTVIVANALVAGEASQVGDTPTSAGGAFRSGRHEINSMATILGRPKTGPKRPLAHVRSLRDNWAYRAAFTLWNPPSLAPLENLS